MISIFCILSPAFLNLGVKVANHNYFINFFNKHFIKSEICNTWIFESEQIITKCLVCKTIFLNKNIRPSN